MNSDELLHEIIDVLVRCYPIKIDTEFKNGRINMWTEIKENISFILGYKSDEFNLKLEEKLNKKLNMCEEGTEGRSNKGEEEMFNGYTKNGWILGEFDDCKIGYRTLTNLKTGEQYRLNLERFDENLGMQIPAEIYYMNSNKISNKVCGPENIFDAWSNITLELQRDEKEILYNIHLNLICLRDEIDEYEEHLSPSILKSIDELIKYVNDERQNVQ